MLSRAADLGACLLTLLAVGIASGVFPRSPALVAAAEAPTAKASGQGGTAAADLGSGPDAARADGRPTEAAAVAPRQLAALSDFVDCSDMGADAIVRLRVPRWTPDDGACSPALQSVAELTRRLLSDLPAAEGWSDKASSAVASRLLVLQPVLEVALRTPEGRVALGRSGGTPDVGAHRDWEKRSEVAAVRRRLASGSATSPPPPPPWTEPLYVCSAREWRALHSAEHGRWQLFVLVSLATCNIDKCRNPELLSDAQRCDHSFTSCESMLGSSVVAGSHRCACRSCEACDPENGSTTETSHRRHDGSGSANSTSRLLLEACSAGRSSNASLPMLKDGDGAVRQALLVTSCTCVVSCLALMVVVMIRRDSKVIVTAKWIILEMVLVGATLLYGSVLVEYFPPRAWSCLLGPWLRELGFGCAYGALDIKTYKVLAEFRTRKARRVHVRDKDLVKYWLLVLGAMTFYMASWTATNISYMSSNALSIVTSHNASVGGRAFESCVHSSWDVVTALMELVLVASGLYMSYRIRRAPSPFWESKFVTAIFMVECLVSGAYYIARRHVLLDLGPEWAYTLSFCRTQMTVTLLLLLLVGPKLWYAFRPPGKGSPWSREGPNADLLGYGANVNGQRGAGGDSEVVDISLKEMDPDEIWRELRRAYTQLQLLKVKVMRYENPHIHEKKHHRIRKQLYSRISRSGHHHKARPDCSGGCAGAATSPAVATTAACDDEYGWCGSHEQEPLAHESGQVTAAMAAGVACTRRPSEDPWTPKNERAANMQL